MSYFEDAEIGQRFEMGAHTFTAEEIADFKQRYDPLLPYFASADARPRVAAMHMSCVLMLHLILSLGRDMKSIRERGEDDNINGPSPGVRDLTWPNPVYAGDTVTFHRVMVEKRVSSSKPEWGLHSFRSVATNQHGDIVFTLIGTGFVKRRETQAAKG